jgi:hypothetical protein
MARGFKQSQATSRMSLLTPGTTRSTLGSPLAAASVLMVPISVSAERAPRQIIAPHLNVDAGSGEYDARMVVAARPGAPEDAVRPIVAEAAKAVASIGADI